MCQLASHSGPDRASPQAKASGSRDSPYPLLFPASQRQLPAVCLRDASSSPFRCLWGLPGASLHGGGLVRDCPSDPTRSLSPCSPSSCYQHKKYPPAPPLQFSFVFQGCPVSTTPSSQSRRFLERQGRPQGASHLPLLRACKAANDESISEMLLASCARGIGPWPPECTGPTARPWPCSPRVSAMSDTHVPGRLPAPSLSPPMSTHCLRRKQLQISSR